MAGIGCEWCAFCFDEALWVRERGAEMALAKKEAAGQELAEHQARARGMIRG